jgi:poly(3-hydroxybutyrate) depolymerase
MLYSAYQTHSDLLRPIRVLARAVHTIFEPLAENLALFGLPHLRAGWDMVGRSRLTHTRPAFGIERVRVGTEDVAVTETEVRVTPFCTLLHFKKETDVAQPKVLLVAPLSGHFATLLRGTASTLLADHDVYITDWHNARDVPTVQGRFGLDDFIDLVIRFIEDVGSNTHVVSVCQPCVPVLAAVAVMAEDKDPLQPLSVTLMAGPIDTRVNPTKVNELASSKSIDWFEQTLISSVPCRLEGAGRKVYPGFIQLSAFMAMNHERHQRAHQDMYTHLANGDVEKAEALKLFYDEYFAVLDLPAEFYLETVSKVFQKALLARGEFTYRGRLINPAAIKRTALLTIEGGRDDICAPGQTAAAHDLCTGLKPNKKRHHLEPGVGHYGVFSGRKWQNRIYPVFRNMVLMRS